MKEGHSETNIANLQAWQKALASPQPVLIHLNADTTWLLQLPYPSSASRPLGRSHFNILLDPWLQGPQSDVASWFSTQWHAIASAVSTLDELNDNLRQLERGLCRPVSTPDAPQTPPGSYIDAVAISHEFTDHCHRATLLELPPSTAVFATDQAADLIRSWNHFDTVITVPAFSQSDDGRAEVFTSAIGSLPSWIRIARSVTAGNALYYHSAVIIIFGQRAIAETGLQDTEAIIYSPHGIKASDLGYVKESGVKTLALLHGLADVRIWMTAQLNLGALNGIEAVRRTDAKHWIATHDEVKTAGGFVSWLLRRTVYTLGDAVRAEELKSGASLGEAKAGTAEYIFTELGSGDVMVLG